HAEAQGPEADGFVRDLNPSCQHQLRDVTQAHTEAVVEPHAPTDDLRRESIAFVERWAGLRLGHSGIRADRKRLDNAWPGTYPSCGSCQCRRSAAPSHSESAGEIRSTRAMPSKGMPRYVEPMLLLYRSCCA